MTAMGHIAALCGAFASGSNGSLAADHYATLNDRLPMGSSRSKFDRRLHRSNALGPCRTFAEMPALAQILSSIHAPQGDIQLAAPIWTENFGL
jgi:hypothetical protein